jgi:two-component system phosphate regulon sensor histidine kinase PhoR
VLAPSRRILLYWLLLLLPTLAVGAGALFLLRKEQARLDEQARGVSTLRREAIAARARQIAENVELAVGDVQTGLMATLNQATAANPDAFFAAWSGSNPLVRSTFRLAPNDRILRPAGDEAQRWLNAWLASGVPWRGEKKELVENESNRRERKDVTVNIAQAQNLRSSLQETARQSATFDQAKKAEAPSAAAAPAAAERTGWTPWRGTDGLHLVGWRQPAFGGVIGVEVNLATISARLGELLPRDGDMADAFEVREAGVARQSKVYDMDRGARSSAAESSDLVRVPLSASLLPGWEVVGFVRADAASGGANGGFFLVGSLLVGSFVVAILAGGGLLLRQARLSEAEAAQKTSFVANVSHEFKTPLTTIRLYAELLEQGRVRDAAQGGDYLRTIARETQRLARLVNNALDFSRLEQGKKKFARESLDLTAELTRLLDTHEPRLAESGLSLRRALPAGPWRTTTDRDALEQIVLNLLDNAVKYAAVGGEVTVALAPRGSSGAGTELRVLDRGPGVPPEHRERIFEKFHRVDDTLTAEKSGAGLGLSIARQLARGLGGELRYIPRAGGGAEFILGLP